MNNQYDSARAQLGELSRSYQINLLGGSDGTSAQTGFFCIDPTSNQRKNRSVILESIRLSLYDSTAGLILNAPKASITVQKAKTATASISLAESGEQGTVGPTIASEFKRVTSGAAVTPVDNVVDWINPTVRPGYASYELDPVTMQYKDDGAGNTFLWSIAYTPDTDLIATLPNLTVVGFLEYKEFIT